MSANKSAIPGAKKRKKKLSEARLRSLSKLAQSRKDALSAGELYRLPTIYLSPEDAQRLAALQETYGTKAEVIRQALLVLAGENGVK